MDELSELNARLFSENERLKKQLNDKQLEIEHCHACCEELRQKLNNAVAATEADVMEREADLILAAPADKLKEGGQRWTPGQVTVARMIGTMMKTRAALARAKVGA